MKTAVGGFIYLWYDTKRRKFYLGSHKGSVDDGYLGSNQRFKSAYKSRPSTFKRRILEHHEDITRDNLLEREQVWLNMICENELHGVRYYNEKRVAAGGDIISALPEEKRQRHKTRSNSRARSLSEEFNVDVFVAMRWIRKLNRNKLLSKKKPGETWLGRKHSEYSRQKMSVAKKGRVSSRKGSSHSLESKLKIKLNNPNRRSFVTPHGLFYSGEDFQNKTNLLTSNGIRNILKDRHTPITRHRALKCSLFSIQDVGKTPFELGYKYDNER